MTGDLAAHVVGVRSVALATDLVTTAADVGLVLVGLLCLLCGYRVIVGPTVPDRVVALDAIATNVVAIAVLFALKTGRGLFVTVSLVLAIIGFLSTVAVAKYVTEGDVIERRELFEGEGRFPGTERPSEDEGGSD